MKLTTYTKTGNKSRTPTTGSDRIFKADANPQLVAQAVRVYLSNQRQGTSKVKTRSEVKRSKKKIYRQKGTGNARHGSKNAPIFVGGGVAHGPTGLQHWRLNLTRQLKNKALISALSQQAAQISVWDGLDGLSGKTKDAAAVIDKLTQPKDKILIILSEPKIKIVRSLRNLERVTITSVKRLNAYEVAWADQILMTSRAVGDLEDKLLKFTTESKKTQAKKSPKTTKKSTTSKSKKK